MELKRYRRNWRQTCYSCGHYDESFWSYLKMRFIGERRKDPGVYGPLLSDTLLDEFRVHNVIRPLFRVEDGPPTTFTFPIEKDS